MGIDGDRRIGKHGESVYQGAALDEADETNPDMLRNTPSNIRRLADEIEQCEGRQKYLAHTRSPSDGGDVRWYFCKVPLGVNELAASIPRTEIVGKGEYFRFGMRDSLAIEASFLQKEEELLSYWWKEYAECSEGPRGRPSSSTKIELAPDSEASELYAVEEERVGVPVKGGLYEVDLVKRHLFPVYWNGENRRVLRGHWFAQNGGLDWLPLREDIAEQLEFAYRRQVWHRRTFQPSGLFAARVNLHGFTPGLHALFTGEDDTWEAWLNVDPSGFSGVISLGANRVKLRRGYAISPSPKPTQDELRQQKEEEMDDYCSQVPVRHLVFMVHGIGQRLEKSNLVDDVTNFRHITSSLAEKHLTSYQRGAQRVLFIPCQWRKGLKLSSESAVEKITLDGVRGLRTMLSATVHDVLYYMSPIYCQDIIDSVSTQLNRLYLKFLKRNPGYDGKVSLYGHSLGSVLSYDILCHQENLSSPFPMDCMYTEDVRKDESPKNARRLSLESSMADGTEASPADKSIDQPVPVFLENSPAEVPCTHMDTSSSSPSATEEDSTERGCKMLIGTSSSPTDVHDFVCDSNHMLPPSNGVLDEANGIEDENEASSRETTGITNVVTNVTSQDMSDKDKQITILKEEVDFLKSRVMELESQVAVKPSQVSHNEHAPRPYQDNAGELPEGQDDPPMSYKPYVKYTKLEFKVDTFFAVGSPLGVFLALRNVRIGIGEGKDYWGEENIVEEMPACQQMFNIFHPFDPVAYRVEPLVCKEYVGKRPVIVPYHKGGKRLHIGLQDFAEDIAARSQAVMNHLSSVRAKVLSVCESRNKESLEDAAINDQEENARSYGAMMMERLTGSEEGRIDHVLQDKTFQHPYISAIGSHTNYWRDHDTALFILKHIYRDIPSEPRYGESSFGRISKDVRESSGWSDSKGTADEPLLLSSESIFSTNFSTQSKAR